MRMGWLVALFFVAACSPQTSAQSPVPAPTQTAEQLGYRWERLTEHAAFPGSYNFPVTIAPDGRFVALHPEGTWESRDGVEWTRAELPQSGMNSAFLKYVEHQGAVYALGKYHGQDFNITIDPVIQRTSEFRQWEQLGQSSSLPKRFFYGAVSFNGWMWIVGGRSGLFQEASVWRSRDGLAWERARTGTPFGARDRPKMIVFKDRLWIIGGGGRGAVWSSAEGLSWTEEAKSLGSPDSFGYSAAVFDGKLWLVGANRSAGFSSACLVSDDGRNWTAVDAPWSPRGAVAVWVHGDALYMTGGKYSRPAPGGGQEFIYSNDVWRMTRRG